MKKKRSTNPLTCCPICGQPYHSRCRPSTYASIDAANTRADRNDDIASDKTWYPQPRDYAVRLKEGFLMLGLEEDSAAE